jgi:hypothetical protein
MSSTLKADGPALHAEDAHALGQAALDADAPGRKPGGATSSPSSSAQEHKPVWNSLEITKLVVGTLTPIAICVIGLLFTYANESSRETSRYGREQANLDEIRNRDIAKNLLDRLERTDACSHADTLADLVSLATPPRALELGSMLSRKCPQPGTSALASRAVDDSARSEALGFISDLTTDARRPAREKLRGAFEANPGVVGPLMAQAASTNPRNYEVLLGLLVALGTVSHNWDGSGELGTAFDDVLAPSELKGDATYAKWLNAAKARRTAKPARPVANP